MNGTGYIKAFRKIEDDPIICKDNDYFRVWFYLLFNATHKSMETYFNNKVIILNPGQLITGRKTIAQKCNIKNESKVQRILSLFEKNEKIEQQTTSKNRLISIKKWEDYQISEQQMNNERTTSEQQMNNKRTTNEQQMNTNNNVRNNNSSNNNINNIYEFAEFEFGRPLAPAEYEYLQQWEDNELTRYAIKQTIINRANNLKYTNAILESYKVKGIKTVDQAIQQEKKYKEDNQDNPEIFDYDWLNDGN